MYIILFHYHNNINQQVPIVTRSIYEKVQNCPYWKICRFTVVKINIRYPDKSIIINSRVLYLYIIQNRCPLLVRTLVGFLLLDREITNIIIVIIYSFFSPICYACTYCIDKQQQFYIIFFSFHDDYNNN